MRQRITFILILVTLVAACTSRSSSLTPAAESPGPALVVERFLTAANANDLETMTELFGTAGKTIVELEGRTRAEERMYVLASLLRHQDWAIRGQRTVPGRMMDATVLLVEIQKQQRSPVVPFVVVRRDSGGWIIERIEVEQLTTVG